MSQEGMELVGPKELIEDLPVQFDEQRVATRRSNRGVELTIEAAERFDVEIVGEPIGDRADGSVIADIGASCSEDKDRTFEHSPSLKELPHKRFVQIIGVEHDFRKVLGHVGAVAAPANNTKRNEPLHRLAD